jgi:hypothetical protein
MTWARGRDQVDGMIERGEIERVDPDVGLAERYLSEAVTHIESARLIRTKDPSGSFDLAYDAARKASVALMAVQGLRPTSGGGHVAVGDVVQAQFGNTFVPFHRLRRDRNRSEYPDALTPSITQEDADYAISTSEALVDAARKLLDSGQLSPF